MNEQPAYNSNLLPHTFRILVADDDESCRDLFTFMLSRDGYLVAAVADGQAAWDALQQRNYDLLVTDNEMPRLTGLGLVHRIHEAGMTLPVVMASATAFSEPSPVPGSPVIAVLSKPFYLHDLTDTVRRALRGPATSTPPAGQNARPSGSIHEPYSEPLRHL